MNGRGHEHSAVGMNVTRRVGRRGSSPGRHRGQRVGIVNAPQMASAVLGALPLVFVFLLAQRHIVEGVAGTGLK
jgi:ABC-type glycerol-3-phosphate transport system permease component